MDTPRTMVIESSSDERDHYVPKILCIDDDPAITKSIELRLNIYDLDILTATCGMHGFTIAMEKKPDVIITDLRMPYGDGETLLQFLKRETTTCRIPIIVLTGLKMEDIPVPLLHMNDVKYFRKPVRFELLLDELCQYIPLTPKHPEDQEYQYQENSRRTS